MASDDAAVVADLEPPPPPSDRVLPHISGEVVETVDALNAARLHTINLLNRNGMPTRQSLIPPHPPLSFVAGPTLSAGAASATPGISPSPTYISMPMAGVIESAAFTQSTAFATPLVYPSTLTTAYFSAAAATPSPPPCTFLSAGAPITAVCHCVYAQPCALHHRPITYTPHTFPAFAGPMTPSGLAASSHSHGLPPGPTNVIQTPIQIPSLPPTMVPPSIRSSSMRMKRPSVNTGPSSSETDHLAQAVGSNRAPKLRRVASAEGEPSTSVHPGASHPGENEGVAIPGAATSAAVCCECRHRAAVACVPCTCHQHCPQHSSCPCTRSSAATARREVDMNPMHDILLSSRLAQIERERQANSLWFHRQSIATGGLVGVDVVTRRVAPHPLVMLPRYHHPLMELSMVLLQPHETTVVVGGAAPPSSEPLPIGASIEQIEMFSTMRKYVKEGNVPENELERCTVCLMDFETGEEVRFLRCTHVFHVDCIDRWLVYNKKCPVCRLDLDKPIDVHS